MGIFVFKFLDAGFEAAYFVFFVAKLAFVEVVLRTGDKADIARFVIAVAVDTIHVQSGVVPAFAGLHMLEEGRATVTPFLADFNAPCAVAFVAIVGWDMATGDSG